MKNRKNNILIGLKKYINDTPREQILKDWHELDYLNDIGPTAKEFIEFQESFTANSSNTKTKP